MGFLGGVFLAVALQAVPADTVAGPVFNPSVCAKKRVDACGCHHVYGIRHCHPNRKGEHCEAPVKARMPDEKDDTSRSRVEAPEADPTPAQATPAPAPRQEPEKKRFDPKKSVPM